MNFMRYSLAITILIPLFLVNLTPCCYAAAYFTPSRVDLAGSDSIDWEVLLESPNPENPFAITSTRGFEVEVSKTNTQAFNLTVEGISNGNFALGDATLIASGNDLFPPVLRFDFGRYGVRAGGLQIANQYYGPFVARIEAFDESLTSIGYFDADGITTNRQDNSAIFVGIGDDSRLIHAIEFSIVAAADGRGNFSVNRFDFIPAPEPSFFLLAMIGTASLLGIRRPYRLLHCLVGGRWLNGTTY